MGATDTFTRPHPARAYYCPSPVSPWALLLYISFVPAGYWRCTAVKPTETLGMCSVAQHFYSAWCLLLYIPSISVGFTSLHLLCPGGILEMYSSKAHGDTGDVFRGTAFLQRLVFTTVHPRYLRGLYCCTSPVSRRDIGDVQQ